MSAPTTRHEPRWIVTGNPFVAGDTRTICAVCRTPKGLPAPHTKEATDGR